MRGFDPRAIGSGNIGANNVARVGGTSAAVLTLVGDALKGAIPVLIARAAGFPAAAIAWVGLAAFIGAICSVFLGFRGGKGIAAGLGIWLAISPMVIVCALAAFIVVVAISRIVSLASIGAAIMLPPAVAILGLPQSLFAACNPDDGARAVSLSREYPAPVPRRGADVSAQAQQPHECCVLEKCLPINRTPVS